jgi:hypothetical protein
MTSSILGAVVLIVFIGLLGAVGLVIWGTANRTKWGINLRPTQCPRCQTPAPMLRKPASLNEALWGGWTCPNCGCHVDKWGRDASTSASG